MGVREIERFLGQWQMDARDSPADDSVADAPGAGTVVCPAAAGTRLDGFGDSHDPGTGPPHHWPMGRRLRRGWGWGFDFRADRGVPPALREAQQAELRAAVQESPAKSGIELANWNWKVVRQFVLESLGISLSRSSCLNYLHRLGFALKRPKKRLVKADKQKRESFVAEYAVRWDEAGRSGARIFFADEAHFRADAELRDKWVLKGEPALVDSTSPRYGEKASYYSAVCLETGEVEWMELEGNSNSGTSAAFLEQLRQKRSGPLDVIWDNAPAHRGEAVREYLRTPGLGLRLTNLPAYSPDFNADEAIWGWVREEATGNLCLGTKSMVQERVGNFFASLASRKEEVKRRCRTVLQSRAEGLLRDPQPPSQPTANAHPTLALV